MGSPFKTMIGGVSPLLQIEEEKKPKGTTIGSDIAKWITPESAGEALLGVIPIGGKGISKWLTKSKAGKQLLKKIPGLSKLFTKTKIQKNQPFDFVGGVGAKGSKSGGWKKDIHMGSGSKVREFQLNEMKSIGKNLDDIGFDATKLTQKDVKFRGIISGRSVVEVKLPNGQTQLFYKSTDYSGKGVEDMWQAYGGHANVGNVKGWFIKDKGFKDFYGSKSFRDISGNLDRLAVEGGFQKHITKGQGYASKR